MKKMLLGWLVWGNLGAILALFGLPFTTLGFWVILVSVMAIAQYEKYR